MVLVESCFWGDTVTRAFRIPHPSSELQACASGKEAVLQRNKKMVNDLVMRDSVGFFKLKISFRVDRYSFSSVSSAEERVLTRFYRRFANTVAKVSGFVTPVQLAVRR